MKLTNENGVSCAVTSERATESMPLASARAEMTRAPLPKLARTDGIESVCPAPM